VSLVLFASKYVDLIVPGYTHLQRGTACSAATYSRILNPFVLMAGRVMFAFEENGSSKIEVSYILFLFNDAKEIQQFSWFF
jgi:hypothetical protein